MIYGKFGVIAVNVILDRFHCLYTVNIRYGYG